MSKQLKKQESLKYKESINFSNLIKYWIKLKTIDTNHLNFGLINEKRLKLQKLLFEKGQLALDSEFLILESKFFYLFNCLDLKNKEFERAFSRDACKEQLIDKDYLNNRSPEYWLFDLQGNIQNHQTYELIKLNVTDLITQWTRVYNELWIYNDQFHYQLWFKHKFEQFKQKIKSYQCIVIYKLILNLFNSMSRLIKNTSFDKKDDYLELIQTILLQLTIEYEIYFKVKRKASKTTGYEFYSSLVIKKIAYLNSKRCNLNLLSNSKMNSISLIGCLKDNVVLDKKKWFANLNDLGLIEVNKRLFEKFTDHSFRAWFQPDEQNSFDSTSIDRNSLDKSIDKNYDKMYNRTFDKTGNRSNDELSDKSSEKSNDKTSKATKNRSKDKAFSSKFNELITKQQALNLSYHNLQLINNEPSAKLIDYLEKLYWNKFWFYLNFHLKHSSLKATYQSMINDEEMTAKEKTNQFQKLLDNIKSDFLIEKMFEQFYECKCFDLYMSI